MAERDCVNGTRHIQINMGDRQKQCTDLDECWDVDEYNLCKDNNFNASSTLQSRNVSSGTKGKAHDREEDRSELGHGLMWAGPGENKILIKFDVKSFFENRSAIQDIGKINNMTFRISGDAQIMKDILKAHGFTELSILCHYANFSWIGNSLSQLTIDQLLKYQTINHFVGSTHLTRKDKLYKNVSKLKKKKGAQHFDFLPISFILPKDKNKFKEYCKSDPGPFIVKPVGLSRGRGVYLIKNPNDLAETIEDEEVIVSKYVNNPLVIDGYKTDLRLYVLVTSFNPLVIYMYQEGLTRFATVKYNKDVDHLNSLRMHLTNYSINACSGNYIKNEDSSIEDFGSKWTLSALLRYFQANGLDTVALMTSLEDVIVKTVLSVEKPFARGGRIYQHTPSNCFEIFGFDIMLDENYKPWLLEVNLSPSLVCSTPLDIKVKSNMLCDLLNLVGVEAYKKEKPVDDESCDQFFSHYIHRTVGYFCFCHMRDKFQQLFLRQRKYKRYRDLMATYRRQSAQGRQRMYPLQVRHTASVKHRKRQEKRRARLLSKLTKKEQKMVTRLTNEEARCGGWVRVFPLRDSWRRYRNYLQYPTSKNLILHQRLYPDQHQDWSTPKKKPQAPTASKSEKDLLKNSPWAQKQNLTEERLETVRRVKRYHNRLEIGPPPLFSVRSVCRDYTRVEEDMALEQDIRKTLLNQIVKGRVFTEVQARTAFLKYLTNIKQILRESANMTDMPVNPPVPIIKDLLFQLLGQCSDLIIDPSKPSAEYTLDSCLTGFLYHYHQETRRLLARNEQFRQQAAGDTKHKRANASAFVTPELFEDFVHSADPWEVEELLLTYVHTHGDVGIFMKSRVQNGVRAGGGDGAAKTRDRLWVPEHPDAGEVWTTV